MTSKQNLSRRAAMQQQVALEQKRKRTNRIVAAVSAIVVVAIIAVIAVVTIPALLRATPSVTANQQTPPNATAEYGVLHEGTKPTADKPHLIIYEDFRCPACKALEESYGDVYRQLFQDGKITVEHRSLYFLDQNGGDNSERAAIAAYAADAVGKYSEYAKVLFRNQGASYTDRQFTEDFAAEAGITGDDLTKFQELFNTRAFKDFAKKSNDAMETSGITVTPSYVVNDRLLVFYDEASKQGLIQPNTDSLFDAVSKAHAGTDDQTNVVLKKG